MFIGRKILNSQESVLPILDLCFSIIGVNISRSYFVDVGKLFLSLI